MKIHPEIPEEAKLTTGIQRLFDNLWQWQNRRFQPLFKLTP
jgi:hypothetical protein